MTNLYKILRKSVIFYNIKSLTLATMFALITCQTSLKVLVYNQNI